MFELLTIAVFVWIFIKSIGLMLRLTWGIAKVIATVLIALAFPALLACLLFAGGIALLIPVVMVAVASAIVRACI